jgi:hypothetical protein
VVQEEPQQFQIPMTNLVTQEEVAAQSAVEVLDEGTGPLRRAPRRPVPSSAGVYRSKEVWLSSSFSSLPRNVLLGR